MFAELELGYRYWIVRYALDAAIPCASAATVLRKMIGRNQRLQILLHCVAVRARHVNDLADRDARRGGKGDAPSVEMPLTNRLPVMVVSDC